jgi:integrase
MHPDTPSSWFPKFLGKLIYHKACNKRIKKSNYCPHCEKEISKEEDIIRIPKINFHCLRHTHASLLLQAGVDIKIISERLGHSSIRITYDIYSHLMPGLQKEAVNKLEALLKK